MFKQIDENYPRKEHFHHYMTLYDGNPMLI